MRYRSFGTAGAAVSCVSLTLTDHPMRHAERIGLIYSALEAGINTFELRGRDPDVAAVLGEALSAVERRMVFVIQRLGWRRDRSGATVRDVSPEGLAGAVQETLAASRLGKLDVALIDAGDEALPPGVVEALQAVKAAGAVQMLGVSGSDGVESYLDGLMFDVLATAFNIQSGWRERNRLKRATEAGMPVIGDDFYPFGPAPTEPKSAGPLGLSRLLSGARDRPVTPAYAFLERTGAWTAEEICLGFALTEPALTTVQVAARTPGALEKLAAVTERELPAGAAAQIEMARFSASDEAGQP